MNQNRLSARAFRPTPELQRSPDSLTDLRVGPGVREGRKGLRKRKKEERGREGSGLGEPSHFTALHGMQTRSCDENSICVSVRPSVRQKRGL